MKKKTILFVSLLILATLACDMTISVTPGDLPATQPANTVIPATQTPESATTTPEVFIALTQVVPGEFQPTGAPMPTDTQRPTSPRTTFTYRL